MMTQKNILILERNFIYYICSYIIQSICLTYNNHQDVGIPDYLNCFLRNMYADQETTEPEIEQKTGSKLRKEYIKAAYCHPAYLIYMQSTSCEMLGWMKHKLESRLLGEISITSEMQMTPPLWTESKEGTKEPLNEGERKE